MYYASLPSIISYSPGIRLGHIYRYFRDLHKYGVLTSILKIYRNYYVFGQTLLDKIIVMAGIENKFTYDFDGEENLREIVRGGKGGILLSAHVGIGKLQDTC